MNKCINGIPYLGMIGIDRLSSTMNPGLTPEVTGLPSLLPLNRQRITKSKVTIRVPVHPMSVF